MASFTAFLEVKGNRFPLLSYDLSIHQETDSLGRPASATLGGTIDCVLSAPGADKPFLHQWMFSPTLQEDGKLILLQDSPRATLKSISFFNAYCTGLQTHFMPGAGGGGSLQLNLRISPQRIAVGAIVHDNDWPLHSHGAGETFAKVPPPPPKVKEAKAEEPSALMEGLHGVLDVVGMIPIIGEVADAANAGLYLAQGRYGEAALAAAAMVPLAGNVIGAAKIARRGAKLIDKVRGLKQAKKRWKSGTDLMEKGGAWAGKLQRGSTGFLGSPRLGRSQIGKLKKQAQELGAKLEVVRDKKIIRMMDNANAQAGFDATAGKLYVRKGATAYEVAHEMTHAKHCAELGKDAYGKLSRLDKETHVFNELMKEPGKLTGREITHATDYLNSVRDKVGLGPISK